MSKHLMYSLFTSTILGWFLYLPYYGPALASFPEKYLLGHTFVILHLLGMLTGNTIHHQRLLQDKKSEIASIIYLLIFGLLIATIPLRTSIIIVLFGGAGLASGLIMARFFVIQAYPPWVASREKVISAIMVIAIMLALLYSLLPVKIGIVSSSFLLCGGGIVSLLLEKPQVEPSPRLLTWPVVLKTCQNLFHGIFVFFTIVVLYRIILPLPLPYIVYYAAALWIPYLLGNLIWTKWLKSQRLYLHIIFTLGLFSGGFVVHALLPDICQLKFLAAILIAMGLGSANIIYWEKMNKDLVINTPAVAVCSQSFQAITFALSIYVAQELPKDLGSQDIISIMGSIILITGISMLAFQGSYLSNPALLDDECDTYEKEESQEVIAYFSPIIEAKTCRELKIYLESTYSLTERETELALRLLAGDSNKQIADFYVLSPNTVKYHVRNILQKLGVQNRKEMRNRFLFHNTCLKNKPL